eukprot:CAMPEP_0177648768 /NCGR_PEP_ID=MMETSP0447-20121125/11005_1 /TAXON_ID=0 /ORGANISM="Stygamoeba regulata, Strain BSH-02190019" /LENGTH=200 /DNA_ID=CAMNT_0019151433 /DNA_START=31 /DNA_END=633 /DNA_ORIENTATION=+
MACFFSRTCTAARLAARRLLTPTPVRPRPFSCLAALNHPRVVVPAYVPAAARLRALSTKPERPGLVDWTEPDNDQGPVTINGCKYTLSQGNEGKVEVSVTDDGFSRSISSGDAPAYSNDLVFVEWNDRLVLFSPDENYTKVLVYIFEPKTEIFRNLITSGEAPAPSSKAQVEKNKDNTIIFKNGTDAYTFCPKSGRWTCT